MANINLEIFFWAFLGGLLPVLLWLWFWLKEDAKLPEPKRLIVSAFIVGIIAVFFALFFEKIANIVIGGGTLLIIVWATIEELLKFGGAYFIAFRKKCIDGSQCLDEPIDPMIYLITVALGFAALENTLFLISPLQSGEAISSILTGNMRFIGATLLHVVASASIGAAMGFSFYKSAFVKKVFLLGGILTAILLHVLFNLSILMSKGDGIFIIFGILWVLVAILLIVFEKIKKI